MTKGPLSTSQRDLRSTTSSQSAAPVFIVGCGRSGTTLVRLMLTSHPSLAIPQESHLMYRLAREVATGRWPGKLQQRGDWDRLVQRIQTSPDIALWDGFDQSALRERLAALDEHTHEAAFRTVFEEYARQRGGSRWGDKTPQHVQYMLILSKLFPTAKFLHVVRDGRDVALSLLRMSWGPRRIGEAGYYWSWLVLSGMIAGRLLGPERYREIRYEDVVTKPEDVLRPTAAWADLPFQDAMLSYYNSDEAQEYVQLARERMGDAALKHPAATPPDPDQLQKWRKRMDRADLRSFLRQAGALLSFHDYDVDEMPKSQCRLSDRLDIMMAPEAMDTIVEGVDPISGPGSLSPARLLAVRVTQLAALVGNRERSFARSSVRWQRTVAAQMQ